MKGGKKYERKQRIIIGNNYKHNMIDSKPWHVPCALHKHAIYSVNNTFMDDYRI